MTSHTRSNNLYSTLDIRIEKVYPVDSVRYKNLEITLK
jgi:hypothetical protein